MSTAKPRLGHWPHPHPGHLSQMEGAVSRVGTSCESWSSTLQPHDRRRAVVVSPRVFDHSLQSASTSDIYDVFICVSFIFFHTSRFSTFLSQTLSGSFRIFQVRESLKWCEFAHSGDTSRCWVVSLASSLVVVAVSPQKFLQMSQEVQPMASLT